MRQEIVDLYEKHSLSALDRRDFLKRFALIAGSAAAADALLPLVGKNQAWGQITAKDDARLIVEYVKYAGETGEVRANFVRPKGDAKLPGVLVIHENRGLNAHIEDVTMTFHVASQFPVLVDDQNTGKFRISLRPDEIGPDLTGFPRVLNVLHDQAGIVFCRDLAPGLIFPHQRKQRIGSGSATGKQGEPLQKIASIQCAA